MKFKNLFSRTKGGTLTLVGFILSPLSWWNDLFVNFPLSYIIAFPFGLINKSLFQPAFIGAYWLTNILGLLLMQKGGKKFFHPNSNSTEFNKELKNTLIWGSVYTLLIGILILYGVLSFPSEFLERIK
ncbi:MAG: hypothetical protein AUJ41_04080 [Candidatus Pacebacteria bacterium CG1_02_43_31]|nr:hypothetical protein [Candidatus Paceibacterota bacterium]NCS87060.1 hypothetical protein [Candidatus Paceibacterota bacterium]OIO43856.1 MAG: hypothetical protein AUJ41_04080 [Candidatus Pacebacteria bacterium CG1_02_43_31]